jgi:hypothetical protein
MKHLLEKWVGMSKKFMKALTNLMGAIKRMGVIIMEMYHNYQVIQHLNNHLKIINILFTTYTLDL